MTETQREAVPRTDTGELDTALALLDLARHCVHRRWFGHHLAATLDDVASISTVSG